MLKVYLAGPMTGYPEHNYPAFEEAAGRLRLLGYEVLSPHEHEGLDPLDLDWAGWMRRDIGMLLQCSEVIVLPGWRESKGARLEVTIAQALGMPVLVLNYFGLSPITPLETLDELFARVVKWADETFPGSTSRSKVIHLEKEVAELAENPCDPSEIADVLILTAHLAGGLGIDINRAVREKHAINLTRTWGKPDVDGVVEHIRTGGRTC